IPLVAMDPIGAVAIGEKKAAIGQECKIGRHERVAPPTFGRFGVFILGIKPGVHWSAYIPDHLAFDRELGKVLQLLIPSDVEKLFLDLGAEFQAVPTALELTAERAHKSAIAVEDKNRRMLLQVFPSFMNDIKQP